MSCSAGAKQHRLPAINQHLHDMCRCPSGSLPTTAATLLDSYLQGCGLHFAHTNGAAVAAVAVPGNLPLLSLEGGPRGGAASTPGAVLAPVSFLSAVCPLAGCQDQAASQGD